MAVSENAELEELIRRANGEGAGQLPPTAGLPQPAEDEELGGGFDTATLVMVARRSLLWVLLLVGLGVTGSWLFLRYTKPVYKSASLLKLDERSEAHVLGLKQEGELPSQQLAGEVELIKSNLTYTNLKKRLALDVNYYVQGTVLENELYTNSPFRVQHQVHDGSLYGLKFQVSFPSPGQYQLSVKVRDQTLGGTYAVGTWASFPGVELLLEAAPGKTLPTGDTPPYSFTILSDAAVNGYLDRNLDVAVVNPNANTIQISFTDNNAIKAAHIVNNIDTVYLREKLDSKKESSDSTMRYIKRIIAQNDERLRRAEEEQTAFVRRSKTYDAKADITGLKARLEDQKATRDKLTQNLRLLESVQQMVEQGRLTHSEDETVADNLPGLSEISDPLLAGMLNTLDAQQRAMRLTLLSQTDKTFAVQRDQADMRETQTAVKRQLARDQELVRQQLARLDKQEAVLNAQLMAMPEIATQQDRLRRPLDLYASTYTQLLNQMLNFGIQQAGTTANFKILSPAYPPGEPISPVRPLVYAIGLALSLIHI